MYPSDCVCTRVYLLEAHIRWIDRPLPINKVKTPRETVKFIMSKDIIINDNIKWSILEPFDIIIYLRDSFRKSQFPLFSSSTLLIFFFFFA